MRNAAGVVAGSAWRQAVRALVGLLLSLSRSSVSRALSKVLEFSKNQLFKPFDSVICLFSVSLIYPLILFFGISFLLLSLGLLRCILLTS